MTEHNYTMTAEMIDNYVSWLTEEEKSENTISKYKRDLTAFLFFISEQNDKTAFVNKSQAIKYKEYLLTKNAVSSINSILVAINGFFKYMGWNSCRLKLLKHQRQAFREQEKELTVKEYSRLVKTAGRKGNERLKLILETICSTGIRVSELPFITVNAAKNGKAEIRCKGKHRIICLPKKLCQMLSSYAKSKKISSGYIFRTKSGNPLNRSNIWYEMKSLSDEAGVEKSKIFPHNLRHLFACTFYKIEKDIVKLADILGHSSIETTRIYTASTAAEHEKLIERMNLIICSSTT